MIFNLRPLIESDYEDILLGWWKSWRFPAPPKDFLPDNGTGGIMVFDGDTPVCAGFLYTTNSKVIWVDWIVSSIEYKDKDKRKDALTLLLSTLTNIAKNTGAEYTYALVKNESLINAYTSLGYTSGDSYQKELIKKL